MSSSVLKLASVEILTVLPNEFLLLGILSELQVDGETVTFGMIALGALGPAESNLVINREWATQSYTPVDVMQTILTSAVRRAPNGALEALANDSRRSIRVVMLQSVPVPHDLESAVRELHGDSTTTHARDSVSDFVESELRAAFEDALKDRKNPMDLVRQLPSSRRMRDRPADLDRLNQNTWRLKLHTAAALA